MFAVSGQPRPSPKTRDTDAFSHDLSAVACYPATTMKQEADLHNHSTFSDGEVSPAELVTRAHRLGLRAVALTDHDTLAGLADFLAAGKESPVDAIPGVEVTVCFREPAFIGSLHYLVYFSPRLCRHQPFLHDFTETLKKGRGDALNQRRVEALNEVFGPGSEHPVLATPITVEQVKRRADNVTRRHFAITLKEDFKLSDADARRLLANDSPAYVPSGLPLDVLRSDLAAWPVLRILAHPAAGSFQGKGHYKEVLPPFETVRALLPRFLDAGLDGFEIEYPGHDPEHRRMLYALLDQLELPFATGGSDAHDHVQRPQGKAGVPYETVLRMKTELKKRESRFGL